MTAVADTLPLTDSLAPSEQGALRETVADAYRRDMAIYPVGGGTSLDYGLPASRPGIGISLTRLDRVIDYPARDMTITVEAGITMERLAATLAAERQWLPIEAPHPERATLGGVVAAAWSGPRRYGCGTPRDYVIGISAVDGRGNSFKGGGRVVKNVAGYDFCKLLTGSLGTLGIITQLTLKIRPRPQCSALLACELRDWATAERLLAGLVSSKTSPAAIEVLVGPEWRESKALGMATAGTLGRLVIGLEGSQIEVDWMLDQLALEWRSAGVTATHMVCDNQAASLWSELAGFPSAPEAPLVVKASLSASHTVGFIQSVLEIDPKASIQAHAGNGIVVARFSKFEPSDVTHGLIGRLQPAARSRGGHVVVLSSTLGGLTRQAIWGGLDGSMAWMSKVREQFDPKGLLNPGRFLYADA